VVGIFIAGVYPLIHLWPGGFRRRQPEQSEYERSISGVSARSFVQG